MAIIYNNYLTIKINFMSSAKFQNIYVNNFKAKKLSKVSHNIFKSIFINF